MCRAPGSWTDAVFMDGDLSRVVPPAAQEGTVTFRVCAEDPSGNQDEVAIGPDAVTRGLHGARAPPRPPPPGQVLLFA